MVQSLPIQGIAEQVVAAIRGKKCWYVSCGGSAVTTFELALGERVLRDMIVPNDEHPDEHSKFEGEANLIVWCSWRLDNAEGPVSSSDDTTEHVVQALKSLVGREIIDAKIDMPGWDIDLTFSGGLILHIFPDHVPGDPSFDGNWDLFLSDRIISISVGSKCEVRSR